MLTFISEKFSQRLVEPIHEPRAALFVNRFTRTATIMYATSGVSEILGLSPHQLVSRSFFYCIQEACLGDAVRCLESAKSNDSIAYLRFWFRDPLQDDVDMAGYTTPDPTPSVELEAVVSCTSDGLVVILRRARHPIPSAALPAQPVPAYSNGLFAAPWALEPVFSRGVTNLDESTVSHAVYPEEKTTLCRDDSIPSIATPSVSTVTATNLPPQSETRPSGSGGPQAHNLMDTIRDVAVFAWGIIGINRSLGQYKCGTPTGHAQPEDEEMGDAWENEAAAGRSWD